MKLILMTKPTFFVEEDKILASLFDAGLEHLHLYKPASTPVFAERLLSLLPEDCYKHITVHDHYYLKAEYGLWGIHIDDSESPLPEGYKGKVSRTCMDIEKLKTAKKKSEYVLMKYIFHSQSEPDADATFTTAQLEEAARRGLIDRHVYALGGMNTDHIRVARDLGFGGVVVCGDLWNRFDIHSQKDYRELIEHFEKLRKAVG